MKEYEILDDSWNGLNLKIAFDDSKELFKASYDDLVARCRDENIDYNNLTNKEMIEKIIRITNEDFLDEAEINFLINNPNATNEEIESFNKDRTYK